jgi:hypothetical protein
MFALLLLLSTPRMQPNQILLQLLLLLLLRVKPALASTTSTPDSMRIHGRDSVGSSHVNTFHHHTLPSVSCLSVCLPLSLYIAVSLTLSLSSSSLFSLYHARLQVPNPIPKNLAKDAHTEEPCCATLLSDTAKLMIYKSDGG